ncbi:MAG: hypothetical protein HUJ95_07030, partial [Bacteroidales bacterium]|nr:hypothetical protein [Bacteroidales bacterium]
MKKFLLVFAAIAALLTSCKKEEKPADSIVLKTGSEVTISAKTTSEAVKFISNASWTAVPDVSWIRISPATGEGSSLEQTINLAIQENETDVDRAAIITITAGKASVKVALTQEGVKPEPLPEVIKILAIGNSFSADAVEQELYPIFAAAGKKVIIGNL